MAAKKKVEEAVVEEAVEEVAEETVAEEAVEAEVEAVADEAEAEVEAVEEVEKKNLEREPEDGPLANAAVAGASEKSWGQSAQLYTDGISGVADNDLSRAYR